MGEYEAAVPYLSMAEYLGLPSDALSRENLRILGISLFASGRYDNAELVWDRLASYGDPESSDYARDFMERTEWARKSRLK